MQTLLHKAVPWGGGGSGIGVGVPHDKDNDTYMTPQDMQDCPGLQPRLAQKKKKKQKKTSHWVITVWNQQVYIYFSPHGKEASAKTLQTKIKVQMRCCHPQALGNGVPLGETLVNATSSFSCKQISIGSPCLSFYNDSWRHLASLIVFLRNKIKFLPFPYLCSMLRFRCPLKFAAVLRTCAQPAS